ncbi:MAG TPA: TraR/DksA C4-type zinc finger protein [Thermoanaerobaculia bacterium]|nr:TraR/DksA C4-type zinc finger protein [Thermoanaerobaculia bacterium]
MGALTDPQIESFRQRLLAAKAAAEALLARTAEDSRPIEASGSAIGRLTRMDAIQVQAMGQMSRAQLEVRLRQIDAALDSIAAGTYGLCRQCKGPIARQRLEALPEAPFCLDCQERFEREG